MKEIPWKNMQKNIGTENKMLMSRHWGCLNTAIQKACKLTKLVWREKISNWQRFCNVKRSPLFENIPQGSPKDTSYHKPKCSKLKSVPFLLCHVELWDFFTLDSNTKYYYILSANFQKNPIFKKHRLENFVTEIQTNYLTRLEFFAILPHN